MEQLCQQVWNKSNNSLGTTVTIEYSVVTQIAECSNFYCSTVTCNASANGRQRYTLQCYSCFCMVKFFTIVPNSSRRHHETIPKDDEVQKTNKPFKPFKLL